ncbi:MAG: hypothetical protein ACETVP_02350 [Candidatus Bathyarchaeia archaeon]
MKKKKNRETEIVVRTDRCTIRRDETKEPKGSKVKRFFKAVSRLMYDSLYGSVLHFFKTVNPRVRSSYSSLILYAMKCETSEHVKSLIKVFKWLVLPASLIYVCVGLFFGENALDSMFLGILIFFYSNFLPDLPSIFRKKRTDEDDLVPEDKYVVLLFAPLFILASFFGIRLGWKTPKIFHNFKSLTIYGAFLLLLSIFAFGDFPISIGDITEIFSLPFYGLIGYLTHLKVDKIW